MQAGTKATTLRGPSRGGKGTGTQNSGQTAMGTGSPTDSDGGK